MLWLFLAMLYGMGFGLTLIGQLLLIGLIRTNTTWLKFLSKVVFWPVTWFLFGYGILSEKSMS